MKTIKAEDIEYKCVHCGKTFRLGDDVSFTIDGNDWNVECPHCKEWGIMNVDDKFEYSLGNIINQDVLWEGDTPPRLLPIYLGIDPGANGGFAWLDNEGRILECVKMPATPEDVLTAIGSYACSRVVCFMEKVGGIPGQGAAASFSFGKGYGELTMALLAKGVSTTLVTPQKWQKHFNLGGKKGETKTSHKNRIKAWAQQRFPQQKVTLWAADALAIASYGFEMRK